MSLLTYNGIRLPYSQTTQFRVDAVDDDMSHTDLTVFKYDITVQCLITTEALDLLAPALEAVGGSFSPADIMSYIQSALMARRKALSFVFDGREFIPQPAFVAGTVDAMNGPTPQYCQFLQLSNTTWLVLYGIVAHYRVNYRSVITPGVVTNTNLPGNVVLSNRWKETIDLDQVELSTRTRRGKVLIRSDNVQGVIADEVRLQMACVGCPAGFLRVRSSYTVSPDGLGLEYEVQDQEQFRMPPRPAYKAEGHYEEEATKGDGKRIGHVRVRLEGAKYISQFKLLDMAVAVAVGKLELQGAGLARKVNPGTPLYFKARHGLYNNWVEVTAGALFPPMARRIRGAAFLNENWGKVFGSDALTPQPVYSDRGSAGILLQAAAYYDPDIGGVRLAPDGKTFVDSKAIPAGQNQLPGRRPGEAGKNPE